jgi:hypothetical protein
LGWCIPGALTELEPALVYAWLGDLYRHGQQELLRSIDIDPAIRHPRWDGSRDAEVLLEVAGIDPGPDLRAHVEECAPRIKKVMTPRRAAKKVYSVYRGLVDDKVVAPGTKDEAGPTWTGVFPKGNIGVMPMPSTTLGLMPKGLDVGVAPNRADLGAQRELSATRRHSARSGRRCRAAGRLRGGRR